MFAITPYNARRQVFKAAGESMTTSWQPCRVIGVTNDENGEPAYVVEYTSRGQYMLAVESYIRKCA